MDSIVSTVQCTGCWMLYDTQQRLFLIVSFLLWWQTGDRSKKIRGYFMLRWHLTSRIWGHLSPKREESLQISTISIKMAVIYKSDSDSNWSRLSCEDIFPPWWRWSLSGWLRPLAQGMRELRMVGWVWKWWKSYGFIFAGIESQPHGGSTDLNQESPAPPSKHVLSDFSTVKPSWWLMGAQHFTTAQCWLFFSFFLFTRLLLFKESLVLQLLQGC